MDDCTLFEFPYKAFLWPQTTPDEEEISEATP